MKGFTVRIDKKKIYIHYKNKDDILIDKSYFINQYKKEGEKLVDNKEVNTLVVKSIDEKVNTINNLPNVSKEEKKKLVLEIKNKENIKKLRQSVTLKVAFLKSQELATKKLDKLIASIENIISKEV